MLTQFLLFVIAILLVSIFWVLSKINTLLKKSVRAMNDHDQVAARKDSVEQ
ncbi:MAG TPA: hypothetical protein VMG82_38720 [Candidatus Sulfotelmatobacter sp.]|nr:hypothetical protein [Candidatus Sulfotelmatobacter sp.]